MDATAQNATNMSRSMFFNALTPANRAMVETKSTPTIMPINWRIMEIETLFLRRTQPDTARMNDKNEPRVAR